MAEQLPKEQLARCPFCGYEAELYADDNNRWKQVVCNGCGAKAPEQLTEGAAIAAWNRRYTPYDAKAHQAAYP